MSIYFSLGLLRLQRVQCYPPCPVFCFKGEIILEVDGTVPTHPVLQHIGITAWPGESCSKNSLNISTITLLSIFRLNMGFGS
ncbi:hypothetical protein SLE2022_142570 [Rubroshorea leprosula]